MEMGMDCKSKHNTLSIPSALTKRKKNLVVYILKGSVCFFRFRILILCFWEAMT